MTERGAPQKGRDRNFEFTTALMAIPLGLALSAYVVVSLNYDDQNCYMIDYGIYKYWIPNLIIDKTKISSIFGGMQTCEYFSTVTVFGISLIFWTIWKSINEFNRKFYSLEGKLAKLFLIPFIGSLIFLNLDFVNYGTIYRKSYLLPMTYNLFLDLFFQFIFFMNLGVLITGLLETLRKRRSAKASVEMRSGVNKNGD